MTQSTFERLTVLVPSEYEEANRRFTNLEDIRYSEVKRNNE